MIPAWPDFWKLACWKHSRGITFNVDVLWQKGGVSDLRKENFRWVNTTHKYEILFRRGVPRVFVTSQSLQIKRRPETFGGPWHWMTSRAALPSRFCQVAVLHLDEVKDAQVGRFFLFSLALLFLETMVTKP